MALLRKCSIVLGRYGSPYGGLLFGCMHCRYAIKCFAKVGRNFRQEMSNYRKLGIQRKR